MLYKRMIEREYARMRALSFSSLNHKGIDILLLRADLLPANVKTSIGICLVAHYIDQGLINGQTTAVVIQGSGNTARGVKLAIDELRPDIKVIAVVYKETSASAISNLKTLGIEVIQETPYSEGRIGREEVAEEIAEKRGVVYLEQHEQPKIIEIQEKTLGRVSVQLFGNLVTHFTAGVGTGGTFFGVTKALRKNNPDVTTTIVEGLGSRLKLWHAYLSVREGSFEKQEAAIETVLAIYEAVGVETSLKCYPNRKDPRRWFEIELLTPEGRLVGIEGLLGLDGPTRLIKRHLLKASDVAIVTDEEYLIGMQMLENLGIFACPSAGANVYQALRQADVLASKGQTGRTLTIVTGKR